MKRPIAFVVFIAALLAAGSVAAIRLSAIDRTDVTRVDLGSRIERGHYLVRTSGCHDCHTPWKLGPEGPEPDMSRALSGHPADFAMPPAPEAAGPWIWHGAATNTAFAGPWGVSFTANLTSDELTGIGSWNEDMFIRALRTGRHWGQSRPILPPMPWKVYGQMTDEDLRSIFAYLKTVPAVRNQVPEPILAAAPPAAPGS